MNHFVYILECADQSLYTGCTNNMERRFKAHNCLKSGAHYTKIRRPVVLRHTEEYSSLAESRKREAEIKKLDKNKKLELCDKGNF